MKEFLSASPDGKPELGWADERTVASARYLVSRILGRGHATARTDAAARRLLTAFSSSGHLARASAEELRKAGRVTQNQAAALHAALLLGTQIYSSPFHSGERFSNSRDLFQRYRSRFFTASKEYFLSLHLNSKNQLIREVLVSIGSLSSSVVHPREVFSPAVRDSTAAVIFIHNHPSGDPAPSREDRECTLRLFQAGRILGIRVLDHVILGYDEYFSFADAGLLRIEDL